MRGSVLMLLVFSLILHPIATSSTVCQRAESTRIAMMMARVMIEKGSLGIKDENTPRMHRGIFGIKRFGWGARGQWSK